MSLVEKFHTPALRFIGRLTPEQRELLLADKLPIFVNIETEDAGLVWEVDGV